MYNELRKPKVIDSGGQNKLSLLKLIMIEVIKDYSESIWFQKWIGQYFSELFEAY